jgi:beta-phosphoglucomutase-like phosphatase (HAD superfamily)
MRSWHRFRLRRAGRPFRQEFVGTSDRLLVERLAAHRQPPIPFDDLWSQYPRKKELFRTRITEVPFRAETVDLVRQLSQYYKLAVVTSSARIEIEPAILNAGIREHFHALVCGKEVENLKPAPDPYSKAAELLGARKPLVSARAAGFDVLRVGDAQGVARAIKELLITDIMYPVESATKIARQSYVTPPGC